MDYNVKEMNGVRVIELSGRLVSSCAEEFKERLSVYLSSCIDLVLDFSQVSDIDSSGLGALVFVLHRSRSAGGNIKIACIQPRPRIVFDVTKVYRVFEIYDSVKGAVNSFSVSD